jgi:ABC-type lipoprotein release transport system permease subunit
MAGMVNGVLVFGCSSMNALEISARRIFPNSRILKFSITRNSRITSINTLKEKFHTTMKALTNKRVVSKKRLEVKLAIFCVMTSHLFAGWFFLLSLSRIRKNRDETTMLLAYGVPGNLIFSIDMLRACLIVILGLTTGVLLQCVVFGVYLAWNGIPLSADAIHSVFNPAVTLLTLLLTSLLALTVATSASLWGADKKDNYQICT